MRDRGLHGKVRTWGMAHRRLGVAQGDDPPRRLDRRIGWRQFVALIFAAIYGAGFVAAFVVILTTVENWRG